jgi:chromosome condensin MukBEF complex kleisin-like MukF subunit
VIVSPNAVIPFGGIVNKICGVILAVLLSCSTMRGTAQQATNSLNAAQCQSDAAIWLPTLQAQGGSIAITYETLGGWVDEMMQCQTVDAPNREKYFNAASGAVAERANRETNYLVRHGLYKQFLAEDVAGKRGL